MLGVIYGDDEYYNLIVRFHSRFVVLPPLISKTKFHMARTGTGRQIKNTCGYGLRADVQLPSLIIPI